MLIYRCSNFIVQFIAKYGFFAYRVFLPLPVHLGGQKTPIPNEFLFLYRIVIRRFYALTTGCGVFPFYKLYVYNFGP